MNIIPGMRVTFRKDLVPEKCYGTLYYQSSMLDGLEDHPVVTGVSSRGPGHCIFQVEGSDFHYDSEMLDYKSETIKILENMLEQMP